MSDLARCLTASRCWGNENHEPCETRHISRAVGLAGAPFLPHRRPVLLPAPAPPARLSPPPPASHPPPPSPTAASGRRMRRERSIFEAFLTKIKPTIFCLVSKALPLPRLAPAFPTGQCGVRPYHRADPTDSRQFFPIPSASTPGERGLKDGFENVAPYLPYFVHKKGVQGTLYQRNTHTSFFVIPSPPPRVSPLFKHKYSNNCSIKTPIPNSDIKTRSSVPTKSS